MAIYPAMWLKPCEEIIREIFEWPLPPDCLLHCPIRTASFCSHGERPVLGGQGAMWGLPVLSKDLVCCERMGSPERRKPTGSSKAARISPTLNHCLWEGRPVWVNISLSQIASILETLPSPCLSLGKRIYKPLVWSGFECISAQALSKGPSGRQRSKIGSAEAKKADALGGMGLGSGLCGIYVSERPMGHPRALQGPTLSQIIKTNNMTQLAMSASLCVKVVVCECVCVWLQCQIYFFKNVWLLLSQQAVVQKPLSSQIKYLVSRELIFEDTP